MRNLTILEQTILTAIISLEDDAYGVAIRKLIRKKTGRTLMYGTLYKALDQMFRKGYVSKIKGIITPERDGGGKVYYTVTAKGRKALWTAFRLQKAMWDLVPDLTAD